MNNMFRVANMTAVRYEHGLATVRDQRYSGIALERGGDGFFRAKFFQEGMLAENWLSKYDIADDELWIPESDGRLKYDHDELALLDGEHFYGVVFEEDKGVIRQIGLYTKNTGWVDIETNNLGEITSVGYFASNSYSFEYAKHRNGSLSVLTYSQLGAGGVGTRIDISGSEDFSASISVSGSFDQDFIDAFHSKMQFYSIDMQIPKKYKNITFIQCPLSSVSIGPIKNLLESIGFESAGMMTVLSLEITQDALLSMVGYTKVKEVELNYRSKKEPVPPELVNAMMRAYPDLQVEVINPLQS